MANLPEISLAPNPKCQRCDLWKTATSICVPYDGPDHPTVLAVGEAPGTEEDRSGRPFMGRAGRLLKEEIATAGISKVGYTNIVRCHPPADPNQRGKNRAPTKDEIKACRPYLEYDLQRLKPKYTLTLGGPATKAVLKEVKITLAHGRLMDFRGNKAMGAFHPAYVLRDPSKLPEFQADLNRLSRDIQGVKPDNEVEWGIVNKDTLPEFLEQFEAADEFSFDCETGGLFQYYPKGHPDNYIACLGIGLPEKSWVIPGQVRGSPFPLEAFIKLVRYLAKLCKEGKKRGVAQNGKFDNIWLYMTTGVRFPLTFDIMLAHHLLDENAPHDLEFLSRTELDVPAYDIDLKTKQGKGNIQIMCKYNAKDSAYTLRLKPIFAERLYRDPALKRLFLKLVMPAARALEKVERNGLYVDIPKMDDTAVQVAKELNAQLAKLNRMVGKNVNWNSPQQVAQVLFEELSLPVIERTPTGAPSTGEATLVALKDKHVVANALVKYRELEKFRGTYIEGWRELMVGPSLHFSYKIAGTVTGRWSSRLHQTPRDGTIRNIITAPPGWTFVQGDFSQAELNIVANISQDPVMLHCFRNGIDIHWKTLMSVILRGGAGEYVKPVIDTAKKLCGKTLPLPVAVEHLLRAGHEKCTQIWKPWKEGRKRAKGINFGYVYGMRELKFIQYAKLKYGFEPTPQEAKISRETYFGEYRQLDPWHERQKKIVHLNGEVRNLVGRIRRLPTIRSPDRSLMMEAERQAINAPVQGIIGDLKAMAFVELVEWADYEQVRVVGEVHDSILFWIRTELLEAELKGLAGNPQLLAQILHIMENSRIAKELGLELQVPIKCDLEYGPWGKGTKIDREKIVYR